MSQLQLLKAFDNKAITSQEVFRKLLKALSEPGTIQDMPGEDTQETIYQSTWSVAQSLLDSSCKVAVLPSLQDKTFTDSLKFHTDAVLTENAEDAQFVFLSMEELLDLERFNQGDLISPNQSCTLIVQTQAINHEAMLQLSGPGIKTQQSLSLAGMGKQQVQALQNNHRLYPCGLDFIFCSPQSLAALPRSTSVTSNLLLQESA